MSKLWVLLLGKGKDELKSMLADVEKKLVKKPDSADLLEEKAAIEAELSKIG